MSDPVTNNPLVQDLFDLVDALREDEQTEGPPLGLNVQPPNTMEAEFVFLNRNEYDTGYFLVNEGDETFREPIEGAFAGHLLEVSWRLKTYENSNYDDQQKLRVTLDAGSYDIIAEAGFFTNAAKSILSSLVMMEDNGAPIYLEPSPPESSQDESDTVLFVDVFEGDNQLVNGDNWPDSAEATIGMFDQIREDILGLEPQDERPFVPQNSDGGSSRESRNQGNGRGRRDQNRGGGNSRNGRSRNSSTPNRGDSNGRSNRGNRNRQPPGEY